MSYPRNAVSPERIGVGAVVQISDGAVQTSGVSVSVRGQGGASGAGAGTTAFDNGILEYTPTQGETDFTSFVVVAFKASCIPVAITIVTGASAVPGRTMPADGSITAAVIATDAIDADAIAAGAIDAAAIANGAIDAATFAAGAIDAAALAADASTEINTAVLAILGTPAGASMSADIAAIEAQTDDIGTAGAGLTAVPWNAAWDAEVQSEVNDGLVAYNAASTTNITAGTITTTTNLTNAPTSGDLTATMKASVNTEVLDVLNVDTFAQPGQATPASTTTIRLMLAYLYKSWRNRTTQTATDYNLYNDDAATVDQKAAFSDDTVTADRGEVATGP